MCSELTVREIKLATDIGPQIFLIILGNHQSICFPVLPQTQEREEPTEVLQKMRDALQCLLLLLGSSISGCCLCPNRLNTTINVKVRLKVPRTPRCLNWLCGHHWPRPLLKNSKHTTYQTDRETFWEHITTMG